VAAASVEGAVPVREAVEGRGRRGGHGYGGMEPVADRGGGGGRRGAGVGAGGG
jgi:hypothetical protein